VRINFVRAWFHACALRAIAWQRIASIFWPGEKVMGQGLDAFRLKTDFPL